MGVAGKLEGVKLKLVRSEVGIESRPCISEEILARTMRIKGKRCGEFFFSITDSSL